MADEIRNPFLKWQSTQIGGEDISVTFVNFVLQNLKLKLLI